MRITKVEGSLGLPRKSYQDDNEAEAGRTDFEQLMYQALPIGENNLVALNKNVVFTQCYRVSGGYLDGVECEVCESGGLIQFKINVPHHEVYRSMKTLKQWLESQLLNIGYVISLEIFYVNNSE
ncbi:type III secretion system apparatus protein SsaP [Salmonella enterica]|uniref:SPI-2 type III secretion system apparatus protein SsaP n=1 Tax=Salmonella enterica subsp. arizonae TaxID=59203 RepID=A0A8F7R4W2_SALER|nr:type III secretion system apparatus protein SsaP [Salmonella enterica]EBP3770409.1 SPI-2 type III secretion system apparatus protein SsaP [Salmonella enterica subsp. arizonae]EJQ7234779.1 SPI-2 type III secretion system apparatus protein SsaP [Salmonella enterica subsp. enterica]HCV7535412.1 SPI-2 type III secretion system apparatus protein SsaP [Salmonella enterica subsp. arizonae serovar 48:z4,z23:-]EAR0344296.1 type III secretion system apparatus protein SsaP [Salmonella enterica]